MWGRYRRIDHEKLLLARVSRSVLIQHRTPDSTHAIVSYTDRLVAVHYGIVERSFIHVRSAWFDLDSNPGLIALSDGYGFDLCELVDLTREL